MSARGCLTEEIKNKYGISLKELRLLPYFQYLLMNEMRIDPIKIDHEERLILKKWREEGKITFSMLEPCTCSKEFWNWMNEILWETYVPHMEKEKKMDKITRNDLKPCPFCGSQPYEASCDRLIKIGCDVCDYYMHFNGLVQSKINTGVPIHYADGTVSDTEWYDKDANKKADEKWNARSYEE